MSRREVLFVLALLGALALYLVAQQRDAARSELAGTHHAAHVEAAARAASGDSLLALRAARQPELRAIDSAVQDVRPRARRASVLIRHVAARLPDTARDSIDHAVATKDSLADLQDSLVASLARDTTDLAGAVREYQAQAAALAQADSISQARAAAAEEKAAMNLWRGAVLGAVGAAALIGLINLFLGAL